MERLAKILASIPNHDERHAFEMGYDSIKSGPNTTNCNFSLFRTKALMESWSRGVRQAKDDLGKE